LSVSAVLWIYQKGTAFNSLQQKELSYIKNRLSVELLKTHDSQPLLLGANTIFNAGDFKPGYEYPFR